MSSVPFVRLVRAPNVVCISCLVSSNASCSRWSRIVFGLLSAASTMFMAVCFFSVVIFCRASKSTSSLFCAYRFFSCCGLLRKASALALILESIPPNPKDIMQTPRLCSWFRPWFRLCLYYAIPRQIYLRRTPQNQRHL